MKADSCANCGRLPIHARRRCSACYHYWRERKTERPLELAFAPTKPKAPAKDVLTEMYQKMTAAQIGSQLGVHESTVHEWINKAGIDRSAGRARALSEATERLLEGRRRKAADAYVTRKCHWCGDCFTRIKSWNRGDLHFCSTACSSTHQRAIELITRTLKAGGDPTSQKVCGRCNQLWPHDAFWRKAKSRDGLDNICIDCRNQMRADWLDNPDTHARHLEARRAKRINKSFTDLMTELVRRFDGN